MLGGTYLGSAGMYPVVPENPAEAHRQKRNATVGAVAALVILGIVGALAVAGGVELTTQLISNALGIVLVAISVAVFSWLIFGRGWSVPERKRSVAILVLFLA